ncbi:MAG TPA: DUF302 domain-containing protein [Anaeromyxobacteraceae bacterium]|nr:DUF302 domain-containing protein [Anaeromyxobacteraceae bacterium]
MASFGMRKETRSTYDEVLGKLPDLLEAEGFGVLTQIDVKETLKKKLGVDFRRYKILGACNPTLAHRALSAETEIGVMLPCNVIVYENDQGKAVVTAIDPTQTIAATHPGLADIAGEVRQRLSRVLEKVGQEGAP